MKNLMGYYSPRERSITLIAENIENEKESPVFVLLHELGHHNVEINIGLDRGYDSETRNKSYYKEEIAANDFALDILKKVNQYFENKFDKIIKGVEEVTQFFMDMLNGVRRFTTCYTKYSNTSISWSSTRITINGQPYEEWSRKASTWDDNMILAC